MVLGKPESREAVRWCPGSKKAAATLECKVGRGACLGGGRERGGLQLPEGEGQQKGKGTGGEGEINRLGAGD